MTGTFFADPAYLKAVFKAGVVRSKSLTSSAYWLDYRTMNSGRDPFGAWRFFWVAVLCLGVSFTASEYVGELWDEVRLAGFGAAGAYPALSLVYTLCAQASDLRARWRPAKRRGK